MPRRFALNNSSCQVYMALKPGVELDESLGDLLFSSTAPCFAPMLLLSRDITSRTYSFYYPRCRPGAKPLADRLEHHARYADLANLRARTTKPANATWSETTLVRAGTLHSRHSREARSCRGLHSLVPFATTPSTWKAPASAPSSKGWQSVARYPSRSAACFHAGSVGIIMSGLAGSDELRSVIVRQRRRFLAAKSGR